MKPLENRHVLIAGAAGALAASVGRALVSQGARVSGLDRVEAVGDRTKAFGGEASFVASLSSAGEVEHAFESAERALGPLWAVVHVAGGWQGGTPVAITALDVFDAMLDTNLRTTFVVMREAMRRLAPRGGRLVTTSAFTAATGTGLASAAAYNASKAGVIALTRALAEEGLPHGVLVNSVAPGTMDTPGNRAAMPDATVSDWVSTDAVAQAIAGLCSPESAVSGAVLTFPAKG